MRSSAAAGIREVHSLPGKLRTVGQREGGLLWLEGNRPSTSVLVHVPRVSIADPTPFRPKIFTLARFRNTVLVATFSRIYGWWGLGAQGCVEPDSFEGGSKSYCNMYQQVNRRPPSLP